MQKLPIVLIVIGTIVGILSIFVGYHLFPNKLKEKVSEQAQLINGTQRWNNWIEVPIPVYQKIYIFNVTNPQDVKKGAKPVLDELGPFVYQQKRIKTDVTVNAENDTIFYRQHDTFFFRPDMSNGKLEDRITVLNLPYIGTVAKAVEMGGVSRYMVVETLGEFPEEDLYVNITVDEFLFGGYYVPFMEELSAMRGETLLPNNTFGLYYNKNRTETPLYEIYSGVKDPSKFGEVISYDGESDFNRYSEPQCNKINGSDGTIFPPFMTPDREFYLFVPTLCRSLKFTYESDTEVFGINGYRYTVPKEFLRDPRVNPENRCYCANPDADFENCPRDGVWQMSSCRAGTPLLSSMPHFYGASEYYLNQTVGLNPSKEKHEMHVIIEPMTAMATKVTIRVQLNMEIKPTKFFKNLKHIPALAHPLIWMEQGAGITEEKAQLMKDKLINLVAMVQMGTYAGIGVGCVLIVIALFLFICRSNSSKDTTYNPKKASLSKINSFETDDVYVYSDSNKKSDWSIVSPTEKYTIIAQSPMRPRLPLPEEQPLIITERNGVPNFNAPAPTSTPVPATRTTSPPVVVAVYPKLDMDQQKQPQNSPFRKNYPDDVDSKSNGNANHSSFPPSVVVNSPRSPSAIGVPFPTKNEFSSTTSVDNAIEEMDNTLKNIQETLSSYENL